MLSALLCQRGQSGVGDSKRIASPLSQVGMPGSRPKFKSDTHILPAKPKEII